MENAAETAVAAGKRPVKPYRKHSLILGVGGGFYRLRLNLYYHYNLNSIPIGGDYPEDNNIIRPFYGKNHSISLSLMFVI